MLVTPRTSPMKSIAKSFACCV